ncbi:MAG TPA: MBL fold metallo-hydrolase [Spirochaetota bacterium]|nr:MBL fold metallo-hydrolase [Spirochaetota bacterium]
MNRRKIAAIAILCVVVVTAVVAISVRRKLSLSYSEDHGDIILIRLGVVNSFVIKGKDRLVIVDTGEYGNENRIISEIRNRGFDPGRVSLIVITHGHLDHYGSASALRRLTGAPVAAHVNDSDYMKRGIYAPVKPINVLGSMIKLLFIDENKKIPGVIPDIVISDDLDLRTYGVEGKVIPTPGHTSGSVSVILDSGDCIVGDTLMDYTGPDYAVFAEDKECLKKSVMQLMGRCAPERILLSHGTICDQKSVRTILRKDP